MSLSSPGVQVTVIDQSQYVTTAANSIPFVLLATATDKQNASGTGVASATTKANANKLYQVTSQRDLVNLFGTPKFHKATDGTPIHGYELNEYGLMAAYSLLGTTNLCYVLRAGLDLSNLVGKLARPSSKYPDGTLWLQWNTLTYQGLKVLTATRVAGSTSCYRNVNLQVVQYESQLDSAGYPNWSAPTGAYAINPFQVGDAPHLISSYFYRTATQWVRVGSTEWQKELVTASTAFTNNGLSPSTDKTVTFAYFLAGASTPKFTKAVTIPANSTAAAAAAIINAVGMSEISASSSGNVLRIHASAKNAGSFIRVWSGEVLGFAIKAFKIPEFTIGGMNPPGDSTPATTSVNYALGSLWLDTNTSRSGKFNYVLYKMVKGSWVRQTVGVYDSDAAANKALDTVFGGTALKEGAVYLQTGFNQKTGPQAALQRDMSDLEQSPLYLYQRQFTGAAEYYGTVTNPSVPNGSKINIAASITLSTTFTEYYTLTINTANGVARGFADAINAHPVLTRYLDAAVVDGAIKITHITGGTVLLDDRLAAGNISNGVINAFGLQNTAYTARGPLLTYVYKGTPDGGGVYPGLVTTTTGAGTGATLNVTRYTVSYDIQRNAAGTGYAVGDTVTVSGSLLNGAAENDLTALVLAVGSSGEITQICVSTGTPVAPVYATALSGWKQVDVLVNDYAPSINPEDKTIWNYSATTEIDIMTNVDGVWKGYRNVYYGENGLPELDEVGANADTPATDPKGPIFSASAPTLQSDGTELAYGDLWIDTSDMDNYPVIRRWQQNLVGTNEWTDIDLTDQANPGGIVFADMRWSSSGATDPISDVLPGIAGLLTSNYLDLDAPDAGLFPTGMLAFNTRRSGNNIKQYVVNYFNEQSFPGKTLPIMCDAWISYSGKNSAGVAYFGRRAQRSAVVAALKAAIATNTTIREEDNFFNLIAAPGYPELQPDMVTLNNDRGNTAYIIGDTPMRLDDQATNLSNWAKNAAGATMTGEEGLVTRDEYMGIFYPSGITTDLTGSEIVVPASHMMLRTFIRNDTVAYPWMAAAGTRRGTIDNANNIGYIDAKSGEFQTVKNRVEIRDVLYTNQINPLTFFNGVGLVNYGNKNAKDTQSAMDRTNVARLVAYLRDRVAIAARPFIFEPNDDLTRGQVAQVINSLMMDVVSKRGITEYLVVCDSSNNTPERIDRNELWIDIAVVPTKAVEFVYIPIRLMNTGAI